MASTISFKGTYTAIVTPFEKKGAESKLNGEVLRSLIDFQRHEGIRGLVPTGTTGESPTLEWTEHKRVIRTVFDRAGPNMEIIAGTGSNNTKEALEGTNYAVDRGVKAVLLVDPYYNGPSSLEMRRHYYEPIARAFPDTKIVPYIIPGRTGTALSPQDLAILVHQKQFDNFASVKEATGNVEVSRSIRQLTSPGFKILSGDDDRTLSMMRDNQVLSSGVISVISNIAPRAVQEMTQYALRGQWNKATAMDEALRPLFRLVTVKTTEETPYGNVETKSRNPVPIRTTMNILGMSIGEAREPLGLVTKNALNVILSSLREVHSKNPEILEPIGKFFGVDIRERLSNSKFWKNLSYDKY